MFKKITSRKIGFLVALISISIGLVGLVYSSYKTYAANLTAGPLTISYAGDQLFNESNIKPGDVIVKDLSVKNNGTLPHSFSISASNVSGNLATVLQIEPRDGGSAIWNETLSNLSSLPNSTKVILSAIPAGQTKNLQIAAIFPSSSGNTFQGQATANFSLSFGNESTDQSEPSGFTTPPASLGQRVTRAITYNPPAATVEPTATDQKTEPGSVAGASSETKGETTVAKSLCFWWLVIIIIFIISLVLYHRYIKEEKPMFWWIWPVVIAVVLYFVQAYFDRTYQQTIFCHWFWALELIVLAVYFAIDYRTENREES